MRIDCLDLIRYGHFTNYEIALPRRQPDYFVIYGDNESGKSTLLRGISALLFGVPTRTPDVHSCKGPELRVGATISDHEKTLSFRRRKGATGTLLTPDELQIQEDALASFLRGLDRDRFEQFFGLDHARLREGGDELLRGKGEVGTALFQAAGFDLRKLLEGLDNEAKELFSPKSKSRVIGTALEEYREARGEVRKLSLTASAVKERQAELDRAKEKNDALSSEAQALRQELTRLNRIAVNKSDVAHLQELRAALVGLESVPALPRNARSQRDEAVGTLADATSQSETLTEKIAQRNERIKALPLSANLKAHGAKIEELNAGVQDYLRAISDRPKRLAEYQEAIRVAEGEWKETWHTRPVSDAEELRTVYGQKAQIRGLIAEHTEISAALQQTEELVLLGKAEHERLSAELASRLEPPDPTTLVASIDQAKRLGDTDDAIARLEADLKRTANSTARDLAILPLWSRTIEELESLPAPLLTTIEQYSREWDVMTSSQRDVVLKLSSIHIAIQEKQAELERLGPQVGTASESELIEARAHRDQVWQLIRGFAFDATQSTEEDQRQCGSSVPLPELFVQNLRRADSIADHRFSNARDVAIHDRLVKELASARDAQQAAEAELRTAEAKENVLRQRWNCEWNALGCPPLSPAEMKEWMQRRQKILELLEHRREKENELQGLQDRIAAAKDDVRARLKELDRNAPDESDSLAVVLQVAQAFAQEAENQRRAIREIRHDLQLLNVENREAKLADCRTKLSEWLRKWSPLMKALFLPETTTPVDASQALDALEKVFSHLKDASSLQHRIKRIGDNIGTFEASAGDLVRAIDTSLGSLPPDQLAARLHARFVETGKAEIARGELETQNAADEKTITNCRARAQVATATLKTLKQLANCVDDQQLDLMVSAAEQKAAKQEEYDRIAAALVERNAVFDLKQIEEEAAGFDLDSLRSEIARCEMREQSLGSEVFEAGMKYGRLKEDFERLQGSEEAAVQAQKAEDALARARPAIAQYLRLRIAAEVLQRAMESYREKHQGSLLNRASELFSRFTLGEHAGLTTGFGDDDKPVLVAIRKSKQQVEMTGLSDGARDQLYLSLRLAAIEHHVRTVDPCPVILDDILINSDDARAVAVLDVLAVLATHTQVLLFTHHLRLAQLGVKAGAQIIELHSRVAAASA
jgi:uncharacterized protein YhaN